jgi:polysaccharide biosynthesis protein PslH
MKILWVKAGGLLPLDSGGKIRSYHILTELTRTHEITLFTFYRSMLSDPHHELNQLFSRVIYLPLEIPAGRGLAEFVNYVRLALSPLPYSMAKHYVPGVTEKLRETLGQESFDVIVCDFIAAAPSIPWDWSGPKVLFAHNVETLIWKRHFNVTRAPHWKFASWREYRSMERAERSYVRLADHLLTVSETDRDFFARFVDSGKISVIQTGVDIEYFQPCPCERGAESLVFTGSMDWMPNEDAIFHFAEKMLPQIRSCVPGVRLHVVGRRPSPRLRALAEREPAIEVTGAVEDIRPYVRSASVYVVPLRVGSGTRLKIFEAMAMGKAVVSTSIGAEGLPVQHGENILIEDDPGEFAKRVVNLLRNPDAQAILGHAARRAVEQKYSWESVGSNFEAVLRNLVRNRLGPQRNASSARY